MDSYFMKNRCNVKRMRFYTVAEQKRQWQQNSSTIKMLNPRELLSLRFRTDIRDVYVGSIYRTKICGSRPDTDLYYLLHQQSSLTQFCFFSTSMRCVILKSQCVLRIFLVLIFRKDRHFSIKFMYYILLCIIIYVW